MFCAGPAQDLRRTVGMPAQRACGARERTGARSGSYAGACTLGSLGSRPGGCQRAARRSLLCAVRRTGPMQEHPHERQTGRRRSRCRTASSGASPARRASDRGHDASGRRAPRALDALAEPVTCARLRGGGLRCDPPGRADRTGGARGELLVCLGPHERRRAAANAVRAPRGRARPDTLNCVYFDLCRSPGNGCGAPREGSGVGPERCVTPDSSRGGT